MSKSGGVNGGVFSKYVIAISELDEYLEKSGPHKYTSKKMVRGKWVYEYEDKAVTRITNSLLDFLSNPKREITLAQVARSFRIGKAQAKEVIDTLARQGNIVGSTEKGGVTTYKRNPRQKGVTKEPKLVIPKTEEKPEKLTVMGDKVGKKEKKQARVQAIKNVLDEHVSAKVDPAIDTSGVKLTSKEKLRADMKGANLSAAEVKAIRLVSDNGGNLTTKTRTRNKYGIGEWKQTAAGKKIDRETVSKLAGPRFLVSTMDTDEQGLRSTNKTPRVLFAMDKAREEAITAKAQKEKEQPKAPKVYFLNLPEKSQKIVNELASWKDVGLSPYHMAQKLHMPESEALTHMRALEDSGFVAPSKKNSKLVSSMQLYRLTTEAKKELGIIPTYYNDPKAKGVKQRLNVNEGISGWKPGPEIEFTGRTDFSMGSTTYEFTYQSGPKSGQTDFTVQKPKPEKETPKTETTKEKYEKLFTIGGSTAEKKSAAVKQELTEKEKKEVDEKRYRGKAEILRLLEKKGTIWLDQHPNVKQSDLAAMAVDKHVERVTEFAGKTPSEGFRVGYRLTGSGERAINNMNNEQRKELERQQYEQKKKKTPPKKDQPKLARQVILDWMEKQKEGGGITAVGMLKHFSGERNLAIKDNIIYSALNQLANEGVLEREGAGYGGTFKKPAKKKEPEAPKPVNKPAGKTKRKPNKVHGAGGQLSLDFTKERFKIKAG